MAKETERKSGPTDPLITLLDAADRMPGAKELRVHSYDLLRVGAGDAVVDVGCGSGRAVAELGGLGVHAIGVDPDEGMLAVARGRWPAADFRRAGAYPLPLEDRAVAGYRADKVFHELAEPQRALAETRRVLVPGGRIVLLGQDWDSFVIDSDDPVLTRAIVHGRAGLIPAPRAARRYRNLLLDGGFHDVTVDVRTGVFTGESVLPMLLGLAEKARSAGAVTQEQAGDWVSEQRARARTDRLFLALPFFIASATLPRNRQ
ncbi:SAM-dependent methyltransferase [Streptomyces sp. Ru71]|uniref:methyltransferase domain-containing protein n=1 Tax=Streptomyces sp. Ru71 TaxID=2080746 RepID=UPI000CDD24E8|nr:methyltransferase domain-containing protein [Streptomyces sp. Ru71]POX48426.1 SAM-dependent methyltransferase [Streptomyces sp. Ru71]